MKAETIDAYNEMQRPFERGICVVLMDLICEHLPDAERKIWHAHPVWFLGGNPIVGYGKLKSGIRLMFWSGQSFQTHGLTPTGTFKAAEIRFTSLADIDPIALAKLLEEAKTVQWDYKNIVKRKGRLERLLR